MMEGFWLWLARHVPHRLRYWCVIVAAAEATQGKWSDTDVPSLGVIDVLRRIEK